MNLSLFAALITLGTLPASEPTQDKPGIPILSNVPIINRLFQNNAPTIDLDLRNVRLYTALDTIFTKAKLAYTIAPGVPDTTITAMRVTNTPFPQALRQLLRSAQTPDLTLGYDFSNGSYTIRTVPTAKQQALGKTAIPLQHLTAREVLDYMANNHIGWPNGIDGLVPDPSGRSLIVAGDDPDVRELIRMIRLIDIAKESVTLKLEVVVVNTGAGGNPKASKNVLIGSTMNGLVGTELSSDDRTHGSPAQTSRLSTQLTVQQNGSDAYLVESHWDVSLALPGAAKNTLVRIEKTLNTTRYVKAGETVLFGGVTLKEEQTTAYGSQVLFYLTLNPKTPTRR